MFDLAERWEWWEFGGGIGMTGGDTEDNHSIDREGPGMSLE